MNKIIIAFTLIVSPLAYAHIKALHCGPRGSFLNDMASRLVIPDYFPPENFLARLFLSSIYDLDICKGYPSIYLGKSCMIHDQCYTTLGSNKDSCDADLYTGWIDACTKGYQTNLYCLNTCKSVVDFMYEAMRYDDGIFCPSCQAFETDQKMAQRLHLLP